MNQLLRYFVSNWMPLSASGIALTGALTLEPNEIHSQLAKAHAAQIELLKIDWGQPGFCTEWDRDYNSRSRSCGKRGKLIERRYTN